MKKEVLWIFLFFVILTAFFFYPLFKGSLPFPGDYLVGNYKPYSTYTVLGFLPESYPNKAQDFDVLKLLYPWKEFSIRLWQSRQVPLWNPYNFSGNPHLASLQAGSFYPFNIIFFFLPFPFAWALYILFQPLLAGIFTYLFLKEINLSWKACVFGAVCFAFSSYMAVWMEYGNLGHAIVWLPLILLFMIKNLKTPTLPHLVILMLCFSLSILAGYILLTIYLYIYVIIFALFYIRFIEKKYDREKIPFLLPVFIVPLFLSAMQLLPAIELFVNSTRSAYTYESLIKLLIPQFHIVTAFVPDFFGNPATRNYWIPGTYIERISYIGVVPLIFILYAVWKQRNAYTWFFIATIAGVYFLVYDSIIARMLYDIYIPPIISTGVPSRMMFLFFFAASSLAAFGMQAFEQAKNKKTLLKSIIAIGGIYCFLWLVVFIAPKILHADWVTNLAIAKRNLLLPFGIFLLTFVFFLLSLRISFLKKYFFFIVLFFTIADLFYFFNKITPFAPLETIYPKTEVLQELKSIQGIDRSWGYGSGYIEANIQTHEQIFSTDGYDALHINRYGEFVTTSKEGKISPNPPRSEADIAGGFGQDDLRNNPYRQRALDILGVKYILHKISPVLGDKPMPDYHTFEEEKYNLVWQKGPWQIYENKESLPRVFLAGNYLVEKDKQKIIDRLYDKNFSPKDTLILEEELPKDLVIGNDKNAMVTLNNYNPNSIVIDTKANENMLLFLSDNYFPGWQVRIDDSRGKIYRANYSFRAVMVPKGEHRIRFEYLPESFAAGVKISAFTFVLMAFLLLWLAMRNKRLLK